VEERAIFDDVVEVFECGKKFFITHRVREKNFVIKIRERKNLINQVKLLK
jgi:hypothetical protein